MIFINMVFKYVNDEKNERIRVIDIIKDYVYLVNIDAATSMPREELLKTIKDEIDEEILIAIKDPYAIMVNDNLLSQIQIYKRNLDWNIIEKYWEINKFVILNRNSRQNRLREISMDSGISLPKLKRIFSRYLQRGMNKNALLSDYKKSGGKGKEKKLSELKVGRPVKESNLEELGVGINVTDDVKKQFQFGIDKYYRNSKKMTLHDVYIRVLRKFYSDLYKENNEIINKVWKSPRVPKYNQFRYWYINHKDIKMDITMRGSYKDFDLKDRPILSNSTIETDGPGTRFQIDATLGDVFLVSSLNRNKIIGRPIVYSILDVSSRLYAGIYVGLEGPSWNGAMMALDNMVANKVEYCQRYNVEITEDQWPAEHVPDIIIADGGEFKGDLPENLINNLGIKLEITSSYRGDLKGIVERDFRTLSEIIRHNLPGAIQKDYRKRNDDDYRLGATLTLQEFTTLCIDIVIHHNLHLIDKYPVDKKMLEDNILPIPIQLWKWGIENNKGRLKKINRDILRLNILPRGKASVSRAGIKFHGLFYSSDKAIREQWFVRTKGKSIVIVYDSRNVNKIYIPNDNWSGYEECYLLDKCSQYKDCIIFLEVE